MEDEWKKHLNQVELDEVEAIKHNFSNPESYLSSSETTSVQFKKNKTEYMKRIEPYIRLAMARKKSPEIDKFKFFHVRVLSKLWDMLLGGLILSLLLILGLAFIK